MRRAPPINSFERNKNDRRLQVSVAFL